MPGYIKLTKEFNLFQAIFIAEILCIAIYLIIGQAYKINFSLLLLQSLIIFLALFLAMISIGPGLEAAAVFILIFMGIIPIVEELNNILYWNGEISLSEKIYGSLLVLLSVLLMSIGYLLPIRRIKFYKFEEIIYSKYGVLRIIFYIVLIAFFLLYRNDFNLNNFMVKGGEFSSVILVSSKSEFLIVEFFLRPLIFNLGLSILFFSRISFFKKFFIMIVVIFFAFPTGISRFLVGILYIPFIYILLLKKKSSINFHYKKYLIGSFLIFSLIFLFPFLEIFRNFSLERFEYFDFGDKYLLAGHYDAYQMFLHALQSDILSFGYGFLGVFLFFYPREFWTTKPINSGIEVAEIANLSFTNVSMPIFGEFFLNFSYIGILLGSLFLGITFKVFDKNFNFNLGINIRSLLYMQISGSIIILMRGGLLPEFANVIALLITWLLINLDYKIFK